LFVVAGVAYGQIGETVDLIYEVVDPAAGASAAFLGTMSNCRVANQTGLLDTTGNFTDTCTVIASTLNPHYFWRGPTSGAVAGAPFAGPIVASDLPGGGVGSGTAVNYTCSSLSTLLSCAGSGSDTFTLAPVNLAANTFWAGPGSGSPGSPSPRALVVADLSSLSPTRLCFSAASTDVYNRSDEVMVANCLVPAGTIGTTGRVRVRLAGHILYNNNLVDTLQFSIKYGCPLGTYDCTGGQVFYSSTGAPGPILNGARYPFFIEFEIVSAGTTSTQKLWGNESIGTFVNAGANTAGSLDWTASPTTWSPNYMRPPRPFIYWAGTVDSNSASYIVVTVKWSAISTNDSWKIEFASFERVP
jgi:hypothetical protein